MPDCSKTSHTFTVSISFTTLCVSQQLIKKLEKLYDEIFFNFRDNSRVEPDLGALIPSKQFFKIQQRISLQSFKMIHRVVFQ